MKGVFFVYCVGDSCSQGDARHGRDYGRGQRRRIIEKDQGEIVQKSLTAWTGNATPNPTLPMLSVSPARGTVDTIDLSTREGKRRSMNGTQVRHSLLLFN